MARGVPGAATRLEADEPDVLAGARFRVVVGAEKFSPVQYFTFDVGPLEAEVVVRQGESLRAAYERAAAPLRQVLDDEFNLKLAAHVDRVKRAIREAKANGLSQR